MLKASGSSSEQNTGYLGFSSISRCRDRLGKLAKPTEASSHAGKGAGEGVGAGAGAGGSASWPGTAAFSSGAPSRQAMRKVFPSRRQGEARLGDEHAVTLAVPLVPLAAASWATSSRCGSGAAAEPAACARGICKLAALCPTCIMMLALELED